MLSEGLYRGEVVHARLRPVEHKLAYPSFFILADVDRLERLNDRLKLFSHNRHGLISIQDRDHGDGSPLRSYLNEIAADAGLYDDINRFVMLTYPRIFGFVFNPITVYYGLDQEDQPRLMIYEVSNTFGQSQTYVLPVDETGEDGLISQGCKKSFYVSPFNNVEGEYLFHVTPAEQAITVGVALKTDDRALLRAHFRGKHHPITDKALGKALIAYGWMSLNVVAAIHFEALKLWFKGMRLKARPDAPKSRIELSKIHKANQS